MRRPRPSGSRRVPIPAGPILGLPTTAVPVTEWAPPEPASRSQRRRARIPRCRSTTAGRTTVPGAGAGTVRAPASTRRRVRPPRPDHRCRPGLAGRLAGRAVAGDARVPAAVRRPRHRRAHVLRRPPRCRGRQCGVHDLVRRSASGGTAGGSSGCATPASSRSPQAGYGSSTRRTVRVDPRAGDPAGDAAHGGPAELALSRYRRERSGGHLLGGPAGAGRGAGPARPHRLVAAAPERPSRSAI